MKPARSNRSPASPRASGTLAGASAVLLRRDASAYGKAPHTADDVPALSGPRRRWPLGKFKWDRRLSLVTGFPWMGVAVILLTVLGCASSKPKVPSETAPVPSPSGINEISVLAMPVALNLDPELGPDGFAIKVYAVDATRPKTQPIQNGSLDVLMYDGLRKKAGPDTNQYRHIWTFTADQLRAYAFATTIGMGYQFTLNWGADKPREDRISVIVRYRPPHGSVIYSEPNFISVTSK